MRKSRLAGGENAMNSVTNALRVLDLLADEVTLRVVDVARQLDVANSTAHRLLGTLRENGYLRQPPGSSRYEVGPAILRLARRVNREHALERVAPPHLRALCRQVNETVNLEVLVGGEVLFIASVEDQHRLRVALRVGTRGPAYANAGGKVLLAQRPDDEVRSLLDGKLKLLTPHTIVSMDQLLADLAEVRHRGYAVNTGETDKGVRAVAVGIPDTDGTALAALSVAAPAIRLPTARIPALLPHLRATAKDIADYYGGARH